MERRSIWSGLEGQLLSDDLADLFNLPPKTSGSLVKTVAPGSPGEAMGIKAGRKTATIDGQALVVGGDIILNVEGIAVTTAADLAKIRERTSRRRRPGSSGNSVGAATTPIRFRSDPKACISGPMSDCATKGRKRYSRIKTGS
jgi:S1-C subfamily serine protease